MDPQVSSQLSRFLCPLVAAGCSLAASTGSAAAPPQTPKGERIVLYGPTSPAPAINEAATAFNARTGATVEVHSGPTEHWIEQARADADLIYSTAEFMMSALLRDPTLHIAPETQTALYMRSSVILVRPDNPKGIRDFPDLLQPGVRIMVVEGSGQTGLWEDMGGKLGDVAKFRTLRKNIAYFAPTSDDAVAVWKKRDDIDAWITWNVWCMPLRDSAKMVPVSREFRIHRQCSVALTERGAEKPAARRFVEFLTSPKGAEIFESWGWVSSATASRPLAVDTDICAVCRITCDEWKDGRGAGLVDVRALLADYERLGISLKEVHIRIVFDGDVAYWVLTDAAYARAKPGQSTNPNRPLLEELMALGVGLEICAQTMDANGWKSPDLLPGVKVVVGAYARIIDLQQQGYAYLQF